MPVSTKENQQQNIVDYFISLETNSKPYSTVQRKSVSWLAIWASCSKHVLADRSFQLALKPFFISRTDYNPSVI